jgi:hypothetical protein
MCTDTHMHKVKFQFYYPGFTGFLHGPTQMPVPVMLNFNGFYVSTT